MSHASTQVSADLIWELTRNHNSFLVKRTSGGGSQFSRDPLNLKNVHSRKHAGFANDKAIGVVASEGDKGGVTLITKKTAHTQRPGVGHYKSNFHGGKSTRKTYAGIVNSTTKSGYRSDLRSEAVARASAIRRSQRPVKPSPEPKLRGKKSYAQAAAAAQAEN